MLQLCAFGAFEDFKLTSEVFAKLYEHFSSDGFILNQTPLFTDFKSADIGRPFLYNLEKNQKIEMYDDRLIVTIDSKDFDKGLKFFDFFFKTFKLIAHRLALVETNDYESYEFSEELKNKDTMAFSTEKFQRYASAAIGEYVNIHTKVDHAKDDVELDHGMTYTVMVDINTAGNYLNNRFDITKLKAFMKEARKNNDDINRVIQNLLNSEEQTQTE